MEQTEVISVKEKVSLNFLYLPGYAAYLREHRLEEFAAALIQEITELDVPVMRFFRSMPPDQLRALSVNAYSEMFTLIANNDAAQFIRKTISNWVNNTYPQLSKEQVISQDITLVNYARRKILKQFIPYYTTDLSTALNIVQEIDRFAANLDSEMFGSYVAIQQQQISQINAALQTREQQLLEAQSIGQIGSFDWDIIGGGEHSSYTPEMFKIFEMDSTTKLEKFLEWVHPDDRAKVKSALEDAFRTGNYECEYRYRKNKTEKVILSRGRVQFTDGKPARMIGTITDVTERHAIITRLQESEALHKQAQAMTHIGNWSWLISEDKVNWSDEMYRIYGLEPQSEVITLQRFLSFIHPEDKEQRLQEIRRSMETLTVVEYHFRIITPRGDIKVLRGKGDIVQEGGKAVIMHGTCQDVTREFTLTQELQQRGQYLKELNTSLETANRELVRTNQELESFNFVASHDLQEPLRKIQIFSNRILDAGPDLLPDPLRTWFNKINQASNRMQLLIEDFLSFSQTYSTPPEWDEVDLKKVVEEIRSDLSPVIEEKKAIIETVDLPVLWSVHFRLKQLLTNLISNALKYSEREPHIRIAADTVAGADIRIEGAVAQTVYTRITVSDNGIGFDQKYASKIFELFQRLHTRSDYSGTGIGLAICKKIVSNFNGMIVADSEPGSGSVFTVYLPRVEKPVVS